FPQFINKYERGFLSDYRFAVRSNNLEGGFSGKVGDHFQVVLNMQPAFLAGAEVRICAHHRGSRFERVLRSLFGRREDQELIELTPVPNERREHDSSGDCGFAIFFRDAKEELVDQSSAGRVVVRSKY